MNNILRQAFSVLRTASVRWTIKWLTLTGRCLLSWRWGMGLSLRHLRLRLGHQVPMNHCNMSARGSIEEALSAQWTGSYDKCGPSRSPHISGWISALGPRRLACNWPAKGSARDCHLQTYPWVARSWPNLVLLWHSEWAETGMGAREAVSQRLLWAKWSYEDRLQWSLASKGEDDQVTRADVVSWMATRYPPGPREASFSGGTFLETAV